MTEDKYILMGLGDENSKDVAEIMKSKTARKILDYLGDVKEASEKDISQGLGMKINTVEYNLKKLVKVGLVKKSKNFFWSVKGKKISMYKLARKHIIISPSKRPDINALKAILPVIAIIAVFVIILALVKLPTDQGITFGEQDQLNKFRSQAELEKFVEDKVRKETSRLFGDARVGDSLETFGTTQAAGAVPSVESGAKADEFSGTNIQVEGVDEADIVKNDGKYIYVVQGKKVLIIDAYPADEMEIVEEIEFDEQVRDIFVNEDRLVVFFEEQEYVDTGVRCREVFQFGIRCGGYSRQTTHIHVFDVSDRTDAELEERYEIDGSYRQSRMIGDNVYVISTKYLYTNYFTLPVHRVGGIEERVAASDIYYFNSDEDNYVFNTIGAIDLQGGFESETYLMGKSGKVYVSQDNVYLTYQKRISQEYIYTKYLEEVMLPLLPGNVADEIEEVWEDDDKTRREREELMEEILDEHVDDLGLEERMEFYNELEDNAFEFFKEIEKEQEMTVIHKVNVDELDIDYQGWGEVPGRVLNQFSMDEYGDYFRIATTTGGWRGDDNFNHLYVLDEDLDVIGSVENLAEGERIYSARFMGERAYMVTFRQVDPLFAIDLSNPRNPQVLGELKVTGYSGYLHPWDENHLLGIGMEATEEGRVSGVKVSLFDVSDMNNPVEVDKYEVGGRWSNSEAIHEHKAVLFDRGRGLLVIPVSYTEEGIEGKRYKYWQGAMVFDVSLDGIELRGLITHNEESGEDYYWRGTSYVKRSLYMDDVLYTISNEKVKANELDDLEFINEVVLPEWEQRVYYPTGVLE